MKRIFWLLVGILLGVYAVTRLKNRARALTPEGVQSSVDKLAGAVRHFGDEVRAGMDQRESELREALGLDTQKVDHGDR